MKFIVTLLLAIIVMILCTCCSSRSGKIVEEREMAAIEAEIDVEEEEKKRFEITQGYSSIIVEHADATYKILNDSVALRVEDDVFFLKRRAKDINMGYWRYYRVF